MTIQKRRRRELEAALLPYRLRSSGSIRLPCATALVCLLQVGCLGGCNSRDARQAAPSRGPSVSEEYSTLPVDPDLRGRVAAMLDDPSAGVLRSVDVGDRRTEAAALALEYLARPEYRVNVTYFAWVVITDPDRDLPAALHLFPDGGVSLIPGLVSALGEAGPCGGTRYLAQLVLELLGEKALPGLKEAMAGNDQGILMGCVGLMAPLTKESDTARGLLREAADNASLMVRLSVASVLANIPEPVGWGIPIAEKLSSDSDPWVKESAVLSLKQLRSRVSTEGDRQATGSAQ
jgi:hypothetical protein